MDNFNIIQNDDANTAKDKGKLIKEQETGPGLKRKLVWTLERHCRGQLRSFNIKDFMALGTWPVRVNVIMYKI